MIQEYQLRVLPEIAANEQRIKEYLIQEKGLNARDITATRILKRSIDARQRTIFVNLTVRTYLNEMPKEKEYQETVYHNVSDKPQVIVVGAGPGGLKVNDPAIDLAVISAILSSNMDTAIEPEICMAGEIGLSGEIRPVNRIEQRIGEAEKLGFKRFILPKYNLQGLNTSKLR